MKFIAELCQNHNGDEAILNDMLHQASESGATHVKIQNIYVKNLTFRPQFEEGLIVNGEIRSIKRPFESEYERLKSLELSEKIVSKFVTSCKKINVIPLTTCFARDDVKSSADLGFEEIKIASYDCASFPLLRDVSQKFRHIYISTGATFDHEIEHAATVMKQHNADFSFLHCVTKYPTNLSDFNLARLFYLKKLVPNVGLSDHSLVKKDGIFASCAAIALGASIIERHFTILDEDKTKDGPVSITPSQLRELDEFARLDNKKQYESLNSTLPGWKQTLLGQEKRALSNEELLNRDYYRGRFASPIFEGDNNMTKMIFNWEETPV